MPHTIKIDFLQAILQDEKKVLEASDVKQVNFNPNWQELAPKNVY